MPKDVFISHSSKDSDTAQKICALLEKSGISCWIAPRDVRPGGNYDEEIIDGIETSDSVVMLLSENSNVSHHVKRELEIAINSGKTIFPIRIQNVMPGKSLKYYLAGKQWVEAWQPPMEEKIEQVVKAVKVLSDKFHQNEKGMTVTPKMDVKKNSLETRAHSSAVCSLVITPDDSMVISADKQGMVKVWSTRDISLVHTFTEQSDPQLLISPNGKYLVCESGKDIQSNSTVKVISLPSLEYYKTFSRKRGDSPLSFLPDSEGVIFVERTVENGNGLGGFNDFKGKVRVLNIQSNSISHQFFTECKISGYEPKLVVSPNGRYMALGYADRIEIVEINSMKQVSSHLQQRLPYGGLAYSPDSKFVINAVKTDVQYLFSPDLKHLSTTTISENDLTFVNFIANINAIFTVTVYGELFIVSFPDCKMIRNLLGALKPNPFYVPDAKITPDGSLLVASTTYRSTAYEERYGKDISVRLISVKSGELVAKIPTTTFTTLITISHDGKKAFLGDGEGNIQVLDLENHAFKGFLIDSRE
jgi:WD40 repeat protein